MALVQQRGFVGDVRLQLEFTVHPWFCYKKKWTWAVDMLSGGALEISHPVNNILIGGPVLACKGCQRKKWVQWKQVRFKSSPSPLSSRVTFPVTRGRNHTARSCSAVQCSACVRVCVCVCARCQVLQCSAVQCSAVCVCVCVRARACARISCHKPENFIARIILYPQLWAQALNSTRDQVYLWTFKQTT